jgi:hypothetical protein
MNDRLDTPASRIHEARDLCLSGLFEQLNKLEQRARENKKHVACNIVTAHTDSLRALLETYISTLPPTYRKKNK